MSSATSRTAADEGAVTTDSVITSRMSTGGESISVPSAAPEMAAVDEQLAREARRAPLAVIGACVAAALPMFGGLAAVGTLNDQPKNSPGRLLYIHDHSGKFLMFSILLGLGALALVFPLLYLYEATKFRRPELPRVARMCVLFGPIAYGIVQIGLQAILVAKSSTFADPAKGNQTYEEAKHVFESSGVRFFQFLGLAGQLALGFAFVIVCLNAMRVGLLTRFMGIVGVIVGVLFVVPLFPGPPFVQSFWLIALAVLISGRWPRGVPPAWKTGHAVPWPSQQELREQAGGTPIDPEPAPATPAASAPAAPAAGGRGASSARKRKRKKRR